MIVEGYTVGAWQSNTYVLAARAGDSAVVIDPGQDADELVAARLGAHGLKLEGVLLTHGHVDHVWCAGTVTAAAGVPAFLHPADRYMLDDPGASLGAPGAFTAEFPLPEEIRD